MFEEQSDKLILRVLFCILFIAILYSYKYAHWLLYPASKEQMSKKHYPSINSADTIHYLSRIIGFGIVFTHIHINLEHGVFLAVVDLIFRSLLISIIYLLSLAIAEAIALTSFTYSEEVVKRTNLSYAVIHMAHAISLAFVIREICVIAGHSLILLLFLWLCAIVALGFAIKLYRYYSKLSFDKLLAQKSMTLGVSYLGHLLGCALLINSSLPKIFVSFGQYLQLIMLKLLLTVLIFPLLMIGVKKVFLFQDYGKVRGEYQFDLESPELGYGIYEGIVFLTSALLTVVATGQMMFGMFYPT